MREGRCINLPDWLSQMRGTGRPASSRLPGTVYLPLLTL